MEKKIIAISLVVVLMLTVFVGCSTKRETTNLGGKDYVLATDAEGNTLVDDNGAIIAVVTDRDGEVVVDANGEDQTYAIPMAGVAVNGTLYGSNFDMKIPDGWEADGQKLVKKGTDGKCYIQFNKIIELNEDNDIETYLEAIDEQNDQIAKAISDEATLEELIKGNPEYEQMRGVKYSIEKSETSLSAKNCYVRVHKMVDAKNNVIHYAENYYINISNTIYKLDYVCQDGEGYDESFDFGNFAKTGFKYVEESEED